MKRTHAVWAALLWLLVLQGPGTAVERLRLRASPRTGILPVALTIIVIVEPDAANRRLRVVWPGGAYENSLDGLGGRRYHWRRALVQEADEDARVAATLYGPGDTVLASTSLPLTYFSP